MGENCISEEREEKNGWCMFVGLYAFANALLPLARERAAATSTQKYMNRMEMEFLWNVCSFCKPYTAELMREIKWKKMFYWGWKSLFLGGTEMQFLMYSIFFRAMWTSLLDLQPQRCWSQVPLSKMMSNYFRKPNWASHFSFGTSGGSLIIGSNRAIERRHREQQLKLHNIYWSKTTITIEQLSSKRLKN